jgi:CBS domain-containing protein
MKRLPAIKSVMTPFPFSIDIDASIARANEFMEQHRIRHLPVTEKGALIGLLAARDLAARGTKKQADTIRDLQPGKPHLVDLNERLDKVLMVMADRHLDSVLVTRQGRLAGVFTVTDACRSYAELLRKPFKPPSGDEAA